MNRRDFLHASILALASQATAHSLPLAAATDEDFWLGVRDKFSIDPNVIQLNNAAIGSSPRTVLDAMRHYEANLVSQPSHAYYDEQSGYVERVREQLAAVFGCDMEEMAVTRNASESLANVVFGLEMKPGDEVMTTTQDYPSVLEALDQRAARDGIVVKKLRLPVPPRSPAAAYDAFVQGVTPRTKLIIVSHMTYATGQVFPVRRICDFAASRGIKTLVDGAQSFGQIPFRHADLGCDFFATSLHKFYCAPLGTGFLYIRRSVLEQVWPLMGAPMEARGNIRKFDGYEDLGPGTMPIHIRNAVPEAIYFNQELSIPLKAARLRYLRKRWTSPLQQIDGVRLLTTDDDGWACGTATFVPGQCDPDRFVQVMERDHRIHVRKRALEGEFAGVRVSADIFNTTPEIDRFVEVARLLIPKGSKL
jgi:isopenicillin-N epimerase